MPLLRHVDHVAEDHQVTLGDVVGDRCPRAPAQDAMHAQILQGIEIRAGVDVVRSYPVHPRTGASEEVEGGLFILHAEDFTAGPIGCIVLAQGLALQQAC